MSSPTATEPSQPPSSRAWKRSWSRRRDGTIDDRYDKRQFIMASNEKSSTEASSEASASGLSGNGSDDEASARFPTRPPRPPRPTSQEIVDRLVQLCSEKSNTMNQKEMEILGKLTYGDLKAKRQVAVTRFLIPCMIESYIRGNQPTAAAGASKRSDCLVESVETGDEQRESSSHGGAGVDSRSRSIGSKIRSLLLLSPKPPPPEEISDDEFSRRTISPQQILVFVKSLQACVVSNNLARTQCRDSRLYPILLRDLRIVVTKAGSESTRFTILEATLNLFCVLCVNDGPNSRYLKHALDRHAICLREYAGGSVELGQRITFLEAMAK